MGQHCRNVLYNSKRQVSGTLGLTGKSNVVLHWPRSLPVSKGTLGVLTLSLSLFCRKCNSESEVPWPGATRPPVRLSVRPVDENSDGSVALCRTPLPSPSLICVTPPRDSTAHSWTKTHSYWEGMSLYRVWTGLNYRQIQHGLKSQMKIFSKGVGYYCLWYIRIR